MTEGGSTAFVHYVSSPAGLIAIVARLPGSSTDNTYYTYTDHLGSILRLVRTDQSIVTQAEQSFDAGLPKLGGAAVTPTPGSP